MSDERLAETPDVAGRLSPASPEHVERLRRLVDDEPNLLDRFRRQLLRQFDVQTAVDPRRAVRARPESFEVVASDNLMPGVKPTLVAAGREMQIGG